MVRVMSKRRGLFTDDEPLPDKFVAVNADESGGNVYERKDGGFLPVWGEGYNPVDYDWFFGAGYLWWFEL
jgi:hypothetical protein